MLIDARIEGMDGAPHDHCRCAMQLAVVYARSAQAEGGGSPFARQPRR